MEFPITKVSFGPEERRLVGQVMDSGWIVQGPQVAAFEAAFAQQLGGRCEALAVSSCTAGLHLLMLAAGLRPGDEVLVPAFTWVATPNVVEVAGGRPVFVDIDLETFNMRTDALAAAITPRTVGIIAVHLFGRCAEMDAINAIADRHGLWVMEDAACAVGSTYRNKPAGLLGRAAAFSFHPRKTITTGEGGMIVTRDGGLAETCRSLRNHGAAPGAGPMGEFSRAGLNYRLTDLQGALGVAQLGQLPRFVSERRALAAAYRDALRGLPALRPPAEPAEGIHSYQSFVCLFAPNGERPDDAAVESGGAKRDDLMRRLAQAGVGTRPGTHAPVMTSYYRERYGLVPAEYPGAWRADRLSLALPLYPGLGDAGVAAVVARLREALATHN